MASLYFYAAKQTARMGKQTRSLAKKEETTQSQYLNQAHQQYKKQKMIVFIGVLLLHTTTCDPSEEFSQ